MPDKNPAALDFLLTRRSRLAKTLTTPAPDRAEIEVILQAGARTPDHAVLVPWRFIVLNAAALNRISDVIAKRGAAKGLEPEQVEKARLAFAGVPVCVAVVAAPTPAKIPEIEQNMSAGAVCLSVLNAALASGYGANWITGWMATDREFLQGTFDLQDHEFIAGFVHMGTETTPPKERRRPAVGDITQWIEA